MKLVIIFNIKTDLLNLHIEMNNISYIHSSHATLFIVFTGLSRQEHWSGFPFPSPVDHILSDLSIILFAWGGQSTGVSACMYKNMTPFKPPGLNLT